MYSYYPSQHLTRVHWYNHNIHVSNVENDNKDPHSVKVVSENASFLIFIIYLFFVVIFWLSEEEGFIVSSLRCERVGQ